MGLREDIQVLIEKKNISVAKLARDSDIHQDTIYKFLRGESQMTADKLDKIIAILTAG
jgi:predicted transcriptional regulator